MPRHMLTSLLVLTAVALTGLCLTSAASATTAHKTPAVVKTAKIDKRLVVKHAGDLPVGPRGTSGGKVVARLKGTPLHGNPGEAGAAECQLLADLAQGIHDNGAGVGLSPTQVETAVDGVLTAGQARGCVFWGGF